MFRIVQSFYKKTYKEKLDFRDLDKKCTLIHLIMQIIAE